MADYGSVNREQRPPNGTPRRAGDTSDEGQPLLGSNSSIKATAGGSIQRVRRHLSASVTSNFTDFILLICFFITGLLDTVAVSIWGAFVSMQTGNSIYLGLGIGSASSSTRPIKSVISIASFCFGSYCFSRFHRQFGPKKRWVLVVSFTVQLVMVLAAAITMTVLGPRTKSDDLTPHIFVPLALIAFQSSGQAVTSRVLKFNSLTSVVLTSIYCDLFHDAELLVGITHNAERNRRIAAPLFLLVGAIIAGLWTKTGFGITGALWTAAGVKLGIVVAWLFWEEQPEETATTNT